MAPETKPSSSYRSFALLQHLRRILALIFSFFAWLPSRLSAPIQKDIDPVPPQDNTDKERTNSQDKSLNPMPPKSNSPPTPPNKKKSCKRCRKCLEIATFAVEVLALFGLAVYACLTYKMWRSVERTNALTEQNLRLQGHPWIKITDAKLIGQTVTGSSVEWKISYAARNYGGSPAVRIFARSEIYTKDTVKNWNTKECPQHYKTWSYVDKPDYPFSFAIFPLEHEETRFPIDTVSSTERNAEQLWVSVCVTYLDMGRSSLYNTKALYVGVPKDGQKTYLPIERFEFVASEPYEPYDQVQK